MPNAEYVLPPLELLQQPAKDQGVQRINEESLEKNARLLESVLQDFGVKGQIVKVRPGPVVTLYELEPAPGTKTSRVVGLADDVARSMSAVSVRIAVVPGQSVIGIELPNRSARTGGFARTTGLGRLRTHGSKAGAGPGQGYRRGAGDRRSRPHAPSADRRHHRLGQVGRHQHHDPVADLSPAARPLQIHHGRSQDAGAVGL